MDQTEVRRIEKRIAKAERRLARGIDVRVEKLRGTVSEREIAVELKTVFIDKF